MDDAAAGELPGGLGAVVDTGWLWKRSRLLHVWRKRRAVLHQNGWLSLYRVSTQDNTTQQLRAAFALSPACRIERTPDMHRDLLVFLLIGPGVRVFLGSELEEEALHWILLLGAWCREEVPISPVSAAGHAATWFDAPPAVAGASHARLSAAGGRIWDQACCEGTEDASTTVARELSTTAIAELRRWPRLHSLVAAALQTDTGAGSADGWAPLPAVQVGRLLSHAATQLTAPAAATASPEVAIFRGGGGGGGGTLSGSFAVRCRHECSDGPQQVLADAGSLLPSRAAWDANFEGGRLVRRFGRHVSLVQVFLRAPASRTASEALLMRFAATTTSGGAVLVSVATTYDGGVLPAAGVPRLGVWEQSLKVARHNAAAPAGSSGSRVDEIVRTAGPAGVVGGSLVGGAAAVPVVSVLALPLLHAMQRHGKLVQLNPKPATRKSASALPSLPASVALGGQGALVQSPESLTPLLALPGVEALAASSEDSDDDAEPRTLRASPVTTLRTSASDSELAGGETRRGGGGGRGGRGGCSTEDRAADSSPGDEDASPPQGFWSRRRAASASRDRSRSDGSVSRLGGGLAIHVLGRAAVTQSSTGAALRRGQALSLGVMDTELARPWTPRTMEGAPWRRCDSNHAKLRDLTIRYDLLRSRSEELTHMRAEEASQPSAPKVEERQLNAEAHARAVAASVGVITNLRWVLAAVAVAVVSGTFRCAAAL